MDGRHVGGEIYFTSRQTAPQRRRDVVCEMHHALAVELHAYFDLPREKPLGQKLFFTESDFSKNLIARVVAKRFWVK